MTKNTPITPRPTSTVTATEAPAPTQASSDKKPAPDIFDATLIIMDELTKLMTEELARLDRHDLRGVQELLPQKNRLVLDYNANLKSIANNPDAAKDLEPERREKLKTLGKSLEEIADANAAAFKAAIEGTETILHNIMMQVREDSKTFQTYRDLRTGASPSKEPDCKPVAVNRTA